MSAEPAMSTPSAEEFEKLNQRLKDMGFPEKKLMVYSHYLTHSGGCKAWVEECEKAKERILKEGINPTFRQIAYEVHARGSAN